MDSSHPDYRQEQKLVEICDFFTSNHILIECPLSMIRNDFFAQKLLDRILQVHGGIKEYPL